MPVVSLDVLRHNGSVQFVQHVTLRHEGTLSCRLWNNVRLFEAPNLSTWTPVYTATLLHC